jgi:uncharacterized protein (UPF0305 family)
MGFFQKIKEWFARLVSRDPEEARRKAEIRKLQAQLAELRPPMYRPKQNQALPGFAQAVYRFYTLLRPLSELARATVANSDLRTSQRYFDYLIDCRLPSGEQERKRFFAYEGMSERIQASLKPAEELEAIQREFDSFLGSLDALGSRAVNADLFEIDRFIDLCRYDYERIIGLFDPSANLDDPRYRPDFAPVPGEQLLPELVDFYYLTESFIFSPQLKQNVLSLLDKRAPDQFDAAKKGKVDKLFAQLAKEAQERLGKDTLLALMRVIKDEPLYAPSTPRERKDFLDAYRKRLVNQFDKDRERILREQHENAIAVDIRSLFGDEDILEVDGYDEEHDSYLRKESPNAFVWIKPLRILKTFIAADFEPQLKESIKRILVEGYFDNKGYQNNLANILYQCERSGGRIAEFEEQLRGSGRVSLIAMKRYIEEMRRGKDIGTFLNRLVDSINDKAREIVEDEAGLFAMLGEALGDLLSDFKRSSPDLITNIHTLGGGRNREIIGQVQTGRERIVILVKIMRNFTFVKTPLVDGQPQAPAAGAPVSPSVSASPSGAPASPNGAPAKAEGEAGQEEPLSSIDFGDEGSNAAS